MMKKALFIISLKYPLINALNIKVNEIKNKKADIILDDNQKDILELAERLDRLNIFDNIYVVKANEFDGIKKYIKKQSRMNLSRAIENTVVNGINRVFLKFNKKKYVNRLLIRGSNIDFNAYDEVYVCSETNASFACSNVLYSNNQIDSVNLLEEGIRDYCEDDIIRLYSKYYGEKCKILVHLYEKNLVVYNTCIFNTEFRSIPKINIEDEYFKSIVNYVFKYEDDKCCWDNRLIFFEQVSEPMPKYLENITNFQKIMLHNAYRKHLKEHKKFEDKCKVVNELIAYIKKRNRISDFFIKLHPRTIRGVQDEWLDYVLGDKDNQNNIPWEVYCINNSYRNNIWFTGWSSLLINRIICFNNVSNVKLVIMYNCFDQSAKISSNIRKFYEKAAKQYCDNVVLLKNFEDINRVI